MRLNRSIPYLILILAVTTIGAGDARHPAEPGEETAVLREAPPPLPPIPRFPALYRLPPAANTEIQGAYDESENPALPYFANNQILAFYGHPRSRRMGILGEYSKEDLGRLLKGYAALYDQANGSEGVVPAYYLIYGTCWPEGEIGYLRESEVLDYIHYAETQGMLVFLDHQIGRYGVEESTQRLLPFLAYPNVHLALDPEWRTTSPMEKIGSIRAEELNAAQEMVSRYLADHGLPGPRLLVVHQFKESMIGGREAVRSDVHGVLLVHTADGFGHPALKRSTYAYNAKARNIPLKGFKLFFKTDVPGAGFDEPLLTPPEVLSLEPRPFLIMYQ